QDEHRSAPDETVDSAVPFHDRFHGLHKITTPLRDKMTEEQKRKSSRRRSDIREGASALFDNIFHR
ncbi:MAG: hypothetical protein IJ233_00440, partial [Pyramidobacter sp.]|nr:hypothetical protein [Pyramidobacter sp.]